MKLDKILKDLIISACGAKAHYEIWWALVNKARPNLVPILNAHNDFFRASADAHYTSFFVYLAHLFDKRSDSASISTYLKVAETSFDEKSLQQFEKRYSALASRAVPLLKARHKTIAHIDAIQNENDVFKPLNITWNEIHDVILDTSIFVKDLAIFQGYPENNIGIPRDNRLIEATLRLIRGISNT